MAVDYDSLSENQKAFSFELITRCEHGGAVPETGWSSSSAGTEDVFTIGMLQWAAGAAAEYLSSLSGSYPSFYSDLPSAWRSDLSAHGTDWAWWYSRQLTWDEDAAWKAACSAHESDAVSSQLSYWYTNPYGESLQGYCSGMVNLGISTDSVKVFFMYMQLYHLSREAAYNVWLSVGDAEDLTYLANCMVSWLETHYSTQWSMYGAGWYNRIRVWALEALESWDGSSAPSWAVYVPVQAGNQASGPGTGTVSGTPIQVSYIEKWGDNLYVVDVAGGKHAFFKTSGAVWVPESGNTVNWAGTEGQYSPSSDAGFTPPTGDYWPAWKNQGYQLTLELSNQNVTYSMGMHSTDIYSTFAGDCSSFVDWTVYYIDRDVANAACFGTSGWPFATDGLQRSTAFITSGGQGEVPAAGSGYLPGDIVLCNYSSYSSDMSATTDLSRPTGSHVAFVLDESRVVHCTVTSPAVIVQSFADFFAGPLYWEVRRFPWG